MGNRIRLLYAEDDPHDAELTRAHFQAEAPDFDLEIVGTGAHCIERLKKAVYDVLLLDQHLPDMEGADILRSQRIEGADLSIVIVTGAGDEELAIRMLRLGAQDYIPKKCGYIHSLPALLRAVVADHGRRRALGLTLASAPRRVLSVEHDRMDIDQMERHFASAVPYLTLQNVETAQEALEILGRPHQFDLVLADLRLHGMSALEMLKETKLLGIDLPFIVLTGRGHEEAAVAAMKLGAYDYIIKRDNYLTQLPHAIENAITRFRLEQQTAERSRALEETNTELEAFAHSVSHDLRAPLRAMSGFAQALQEDYADKLGSEGRDMVRRIVGAANRMDRLILDLLEYSRVTSKEMALGSVSLQEALNDALEQLQEPISRSGARVTVAPPLPTVSAHRATLGQVITNLLSNAIKFVAPGAAPQVRLWAEERAGWARLCVQDNGIGLLPEDQGRIFGVFERLHGQDSYPGTGIGLAIVRRGVARMGGRFGVESQPGEGSRFWIEFRLEQEDGAAADRFHAVRPG